MRNIWKPWYVYRPTQILRRIGYFLHSPMNGTIARLPWGCRIKVDARKTIGRSITQTGIYELATSELLWRLIDPGDQVLDIGANVGYMTAVMGSRVGSHGKVLAFEPHPELFDQLVQNIERFSVARDFGVVESISAAVSDRRGTVYLVCPEEFDVNDGVASIIDAAPPQKITITVNAVTLDEYLTDRGSFKLAKIDVEGHELRVLHGGEKTFRDDVTHIVFEEHHGPESPVCQLLEDMGFRLLQFGWSMRRLVLSELSNLRVSQNYETTNYLATRNPEEVFKRCQRGGWQVLQRRST